MFFYRWTTRQLILMKIVSVASFTRSSAEMEAKLEGTTWPFRVMRPVTGYRPPTKAVPRWWVSLFSFTIGIYQLSVIVIVSVIMWEDFHGELESKMLWPKRKRLMITTGMPYTTLAGPDSCQENVARAKHKDGKHETRLSIRCTLGVIILSHLSTFLSIVILHYVYYLCSIHFLQKQFLQVSCDISNNYKSSHLYRVIKLFLLIYMIIKSQMPSCKYSFPYTFCYIYLTRV